MTQVPKCPCLGLRSFSGLGLTVLKVGKFLKTGPVGHPNSDIPRYEEVGQYVPPLILVQEV